MPDTNVLEVSDVAEWELVFLVDGIEVGWCSHRALEGMDTGDGRTLRRGLVREGMRRRLEIDMRRGPLVPQTMRVQLQDFEGDLAELFATERSDFEFLTSTVHPNDDLTLRTELHDMHVGTERIGPAGERHLYPVPLGWDVGGFHYAQQADAQLGATSSPVSERPLVWKGRRCALYRVYRDHVSHPGDYFAGWRPHGEWRRIWWGTLRDDGRVRGRSWTVECDGPDSWLQRDLGLLTQTTPVRITSQLEYPAEETHAAIHIGLFPDAIGVNNYQYGTIDYASVFTADSPQGLREEFAAFVLSGNNDVGNDGAWSDINGTVLSMGFGGNALAMQHGDAPEGKPFVILSAHRSMWERMGWDILQQVSESTHAYEFKHHESSLAPGITDPPTADYWALVMVLESSTTIPVEAVPRFSAGVVPLDPLRISSGGQVIDLSLTQAGDVTHLGQLHAPPASDPDDASQGFDLPDAPRVDTQGLWLLRGKRRFAGEENEFDERQVIRASWRDVQGTVSGNQIVATKLLDPRSFGYDRPPLFSTWSAQSGGIEALPLLYFGYQQAAGAYDLAHVVLQRILLTTGTSEGWSGFADEAPILLDPGVNEPALLAGFVRLDSEVADMGLAIPGDLVAPATEWNAAAQAVDPEALEIVAAYEPGTNAEDIINGIMRPLAWSWSLAGGRYGVFTPHLGLDESEVLWVLDRSSQQGDYRGGMGEPQQEQRDYAPVDKLKVSYSWQPYEEDFRYTATVDAADAGRRYRPGGIEEVFDAPSHRRRNTASVALRPRQSDKAAFWARRHYRVRRFPVVPSIGRRVWPGEGARVTHPLLVDAAASEYGVTGQRARITAVEEVFHRDKSKISLDFLVYADGSRVPRVHAPSARGCGFDSDTDEILVHDDWTGIGSGWSDAAHFVEPSYVGLAPFGGQLRIKWTQWDGSGWSWNGEGLVESVTTTPGSSRIRLASGSMTGVYRACMDTLVVPVDVNAQTAAWAQQLFVGIGDESGEVAAGVPNHLFEDI